MTSVDASGSEPTDWSSLPYAPRERVAPGGSTYAPWWQRVSALLIDVSAVLTAVTTVAIPVSALAGFRASHHSDAAATSLFIGVVVAVLVVGLAYAVVLEGRSGQTFGKRALGIMVVAEDGSPCGYGRAVSRELLGRVLIEGLAWLLVLPGMLASLAALWNPDCQTWHDTIGQTIVIRVQQPVPGEDLTDRGEPQTLRP
jgi:uncharacterized RDD family membrane protein YckC